METKFNKRFVLREMIGSGSFGQTFKAYDEQKKIDVALKLEHLKNKKTFSQLLFESSVYKAIQGGVGIPKYYWSGTENNQNALAIELLGPTLESVLKKTGNKQHTMQSVVVLAEQMLARIEYLHNKGFVHRDIKPDNFLFGLGDKENIVYIIDFGLSKRFRDVNTKIHIPYHDNKQMNGTARYASINTHLGIEQTRRDDLETWIYTLVYLVRGELPWQNLCSGDSLKEKYDSIMQKKMELTPEALCKGLPKHFPYILHYVKSLKYDEKPDYGKIRKLINEAVSSLKVIYGGIVSWIMSNVLIKSETYNMNKTEIKREIDSDEDSKGNEIAIPEERNELIQTVLEFNFVQNSNHFVKFQKGISQSPRVFKSKNDNYILKKHATEFSQNSIKEDD